MALPEDIITKVRLDFSEDDSLRVLQVLKELQKEKLSLFNERILRCLIVRAGGHIDKLTEAIEVARLDWRDLISAAEYHWGNRVRLLELPFGVHPDIEVFKNWFVGRQLIIPWHENEKWTIEYSDIRGLSLEQVRQLKDVSRSVSDPNLYFAHLSFLCIQGSKEISVSKAIEGKMIIYYRLHSDTNELEFQKFSYNPKELGKRGKW
ncbi:MAG TPA: hypothetical protein VK769_00895 [Verrucomicrobiae bacterium]|jgi:hypothetical protein|nr:hypothetical protein [Verrucomicrobiae bacterium]